MLCSPDCPCSTTDTSILNITDLTISSDGSKSYLQCDGETLSEHKEFRFAPLLYTLEKEFNCAGICEKPAFMLFTSPNAP